MVGRVSFEETGRPPDEPTVAVLQSQDSSGSRSVASPSAQRDSRRDAEARFSVFTVPKSTCFGLCLEAFFRGSSASTAWTGRV